MGRYYETFDPPFFMQRRYAYNAIAVNPYNYDRPDCDIIADLKKRLRDLGPIDSTGVLITSEHNHVTLRGIAPTEAARFFFERIADRILGVRSVDNKLTVQRAGAETEPPLAAADQEPFTGWTEPTDKPIDDLLL